MTPNSIKRAITSHLNSLNTKRGRGLHDKWSWTSMSWLGIDNIMSRD